MAKSHGGRDNYNNMPASQTVVVYMQKGGQVCIKSLGLGYYMFPNGWSTFSGFLIS